MGFSWFFIIPYITYMKWKIKLMFETTNQWRIWRIWRNVEMQQKLWSSSLTSLDQEAPVLARLPPLFCLVSSRTWFRFSYSASLPKFWNELEKNIEKPSQFFGTALIILYHLSSAAPPPGLYMPPSLFAAYESRRHVPFDQFDQRKENSTESITDLIRVRHIQTRFRRKWEKQASNAEQLWNSKFRNQKKSKHVAVCQNLVPLVNIKIAGKWMFIPLKMVLIGIDPYPCQSLSESVRVCQSLSEVQPASASSSSARVCARFLEENFSRCTCSKVPNKTTKQNEKDSNAPAMHQHIMLESQGIWFQGFYILYDWF